MKWSDEYATGIDVVDEQHKTIFNMTENFRASLDEGWGENNYGLLLDFLEGYCRGHFDFEEHCMEEYRCPAANKNKDAHKNFGGVIVGFRQRYAASGYQAAAARELIDFVDQWLSEHICGVDIQLKQCVMTKRRKGASGAFDRKGCRAKAIGSITKYADCLGDPTGCPYVVRFGDGYICRHPECMEIVADTLRESREHSING